MKKLFLFIFLFFILIFNIPDVKANTINSINMDIYIDQNGDASVTETWDAYLNEGTEGYKPYYNLGNSTITNFSVSDRDRSYTLLDNWNVNASFDDKKYKNGIVEKEDGLELCWGISTYGHNTYTLNYRINNFIYKTSDNYQMLYWTLIPYELSTKPSNVSIKIHASEKFSDDLDVWGYGNYGGTAYVYDGVIEMNSDGVLNSNEYMTLLVKFPQDTFNITDNSLSDDFNYYFNMAEDGAKKYKKNTFLTILAMIITFLINIFIFVLIFIGIRNGANRSSSGSRKLSFGSSGKKLSNKYNYIRDLPCNKDIFRAYWVAEVYKLNKKKTDLLGAILLKWTKQKVVSIKQKEVGMIFKKEDTTIVFNTLTKELDNELEDKLYSMMYKASKDGILESKEFEKWCSNNYSKILGWFDDVLDYETDKLTEEGKCNIVEKTTLGIFKSKVYEIDSSMKEEAEQIAGLKRFFNDFTSLNEKQPIEVFMWEEYLMYAQILGMAEKVAKDFKKLYPDQITDLSVDEVIFIHNISYSGMSKATAARSRANSYSSGGGGFSSGGGGGGSFGGGGGGGGFR